MSPLPPELAPRLARALPVRQAALEATFVRIARERMAGVPVMNPRLRVQAVDFAADAQDPAFAWGVLITPWFMNLLRLPLCPPQVQWRHADGRSTLARDLPGWPVASGHKVERHFGTEKMEVIGAFEDTLGGYEMCSLFSPMFDFQDQSAAAATAREIVRQLRQPVAPAVMAPSVATP